MGSRRGRRADHRRRRSPAPLTGDARPDPAHTDTAALLAGVWLPEPPPTILYAGDVVVRLHTSTTDPAPTDVEVLAAMQGEWRTVGTWEAVDERWSHEVAITVLVHMRYLADVALQDAQWATLTATAGCGHGRTVAAPTVSTSSTEVARG